MPGAVSVPVEDARQACHDAVPPVGNRGVVKMRRPEDQGSDPQPVKSLGAPPDRFNEKVLQDAAKQELFGNGDGEVNAQELSPKPCQGNRLRTEMDKVERVTEGDR